MISRKNGGVKILLAKMSGWLSHALLSLPLAERTAHTGALSFNVLLLVPLLVSAQLLTTWSAT